MPAPALPLNETVTFTIANGASVSGNVNINNRIPTGIFMPAGWTAADITLQTSLDGSTWVDVYAIDGTEYALTVAASRFIPIDSSALLGIGTHLRIRSGTAGTPVNQGAERVLSVRLGRAGTR